MAVDVQRPVALDVAVDGDGVVGQHPDEAFAAQISLSPPTLVVALRAADEAPLAVPVGRLPVVAGRAGHVLAPRPVVAASGRREVADILVVIDRIARARCDHCAVAGDERHDGRGEAEPGCEHHHGRAPRCFLSATVTPCSLLWDADTREIGYRDPQNLLFEKPHIRGILRRKNGRPRWPIGIPS